MDINELYGMMQPSAQDKNEALTLGLLGLGSGLLQGSTGHYGQFAPALGAGIQHGMQGYLTGMNQARDRRMQDIGLRLKLQELEKKQKAISSLTEQEQNDYLLYGGEELARRRALEDERSRQGSMGELFSAIQTQVPEAYRPGLMMEAASKLGSPAMAKEMVDQYIKPVKPEVPKTREIKRGDQVVTQEWNGMAWRNIASAPMWQPNKPESEPLYDVIGPDGKPVKLPRSRAIGLPPANAPTSKPLPPAALQMQQENLDAIGTVSSINADLSSFVNKIEEGKLKLGMTENLAAQAKNYAGLSDESSRNYASFVANLERLRNDTLRLNKGVQTEGDAVRAWNELLKNINDPELVKQRLGEVMEINKRAATLRKMNIDVIRSGYGHEPLDTSKFENMPSAYQSKGQIFESMPPAKDYKGRRIKGTDGTIYKSNGMTWQKE